METRRGGRGGGWGGGKGGFPESLDASVGPFPQPPLNFSQIYLLHLASLLQLVFRGEEGERSVRGGKIFKRIGGSWKPGI